MSNKATTKKAPVAPILKDSTITLPGIAFTITNYGYSKKDGSIYAHTKGLDGMSARIHIGKDSPIYEQAVKAYYAQEAQKPLKAPTMPEKAPTMPEKAPEKAPKKAPVKSAKKAEKAPEKAPTMPEKAPEKAPLVLIEDGQTITGKGWKLFADNSANMRLRFIVDADCPQAVKDAIEAAGFWWSPYMQSYNKHLKPRAKRIAAELIEKLPR